VVFVTGHAKPGDDGTLHWRDAGRHGTRRARPHAGDLHGRVDGARSHPGRAVDEALAASTPVAVIQHASLPTSATPSAPLWRQLARHLIEQNEQLGSPSVIVVGDVA
jgi:siroheme synthase